jgi:hypothetical protein
MPPVYSARVSKHETLESWPNFIANQDTTCSFQLAKSEKKVKRFLQIFFYAAIASGCTSGIVPVAPNTYVISDTGALATYVISDAGPGSWFSSNDLRVGIDKKADEFCAEQKKIMIPVSASQNDGDHSKFSHAEFRFKCLEKNDPELKHSTVTLPFSGTSEK